MKSKNKVESVEGHDLATLGERIRHLLQSFFDDNQSEMARSLNISQAMISKLARGEREPGPKVLQALKNHPRINADWLMGRGGEPLRPEPLEAGPDAMSAAGDWLAPVSARILPGSPEVHRAMLRCDLVPLANSLRRPARYLYEIQADDPIVAVAELRIAKGDLLLMDADVSAWADDLSILVDRLVAVRFPTPGAIDFTLALVFRDPQRRSIEIDAFGIDVGDIRPERDDSPDSFGLKPGGGRRGIGGGDFWPPPETDAGTEDAPAGPVPKRESPRPQPKEPVEIAAVKTPPGTAGRSSAVDRWVGFGVGDVVAYCALMIRPDLRGLALGATRG